MVMDANAPITDLLDAWSEGDREALDELMELVYTELRAGAKRAMARERQAHTLEPTALVNEVYLRLLQLKKVSWEGRSAFFGFAVRLMRRILVEHARAVGAEKRGGRAERVSLERAELIAKEPTIDVLILDEALAKLEAVDPRLVRIVELRFFGGFSEDETAEALQISRSSVQREWAVAKRLLAHLLDGEGPKAP
jgi:RNA polymerase sigma factor (TIGR02999 family)